jgi:hypothetical protein
MMAIGRESLEAASPDGFIGHLAGPRTSGGWRVVDGGSRERLRRPRRGSACWQGTQAGARLREVGEPFRILASEQRAVIRKELHLADHGAASLKPSEGRWIRPR